MMSFFTVVANWYISQMACKYCGIILRGPLDTHTHTRTHTATRTPTQSHLHTSTHTHPGLQVDAVFEKQFEDIHMAVLTGCLQRRVARTLPVRLGKEDRSTWDKEC